jgi:hypothetical protein
MSTAGRVIEKGTRGWQEKRARHLARLAPNFMARGHKAASDRLVRQCLEGNAWHADHILPVYLGGGLCQLENLRTLCVPCHRVCLPPASHQPCSQGNVLEMAAWMVMPLPKVVFRKDLAQVVWGP